MTAVQQGRVRKLVDALRSGKYKQTDGQLCAIDTETGNRSYCCLGVACDVYSKALGTDGPQFDAEGRFLDHAEELPAAVADWYGFTSCRPELSTTLEHKVAAATLNDDDGWNFKRIARAFERTFLSE